ncbi:MAG: ATP-binding cassette domain-containing protein, partial [Proteobacteria bacterium]|nr:ATP-binding cassette domain-containing protein [Pseudomonadota bacterium]
FVNDDGSKQINIPKHNTISFENISFSYPGRNKFIYEHFNLEIPANEKLAIVGATGCGKSTIVSLLARFYAPSAGKISIGGIDIAQFTESQLRQQITIISQHAHIFNGSIRDNLLIANSNATDEMLWHALHVVDLKNFALELPRQLDSWTGEHGRHLSKGQQKRLSLARAVLSQTPILILDEPTEGLDKVIERKVIDNLQAVFKDKTVIIITHNDTLLSSVDRVLRITQ